MAGAPARNRIAREFIAVRDKLLAWVLKRH